jgi:multidrug efflux pump subunit AcrA (membrane-fusion protein)
MKAPRALPFLVPLLLGLAAVTAAAQRTTAVSGITEPVADSTLSCTSIGILQVWKVKEGDRVQAGQLLLELDKRLEELDAERRRMVWEQKGDLKMAEAQVAIRKLVADSKVELKLAEAAVALLKADVEATRLLFKNSKSVSKDELEKKELEYKKAIADHDKVLVTEDREKLEHQQAVTEYDKTLAAEEREKIEYDLAAEALRRRQVFAPFSGQVVEFFKKVGESCQSNDKLVRLVDTSRCHFVVNLDARLGTRLRLGDALPLELEAGDAIVKLTGRIAFISPVVDSASGLLKVKVLFENPEAKIRPGGAGRVILAEDTRGN